VPARNGLNGVEVARIVDSMMRETESREAGPVGGPPTSPTIDAS